MDLTIRIVDLVVRTEDDAEFERCRDFPRTVDDYERLRSLWNSADGELRVDLLTGDPRTSNTAITSFKLSRRDYMNPRFSRDLLGRVA